MYAAVKRLVPHKKTTPYFNHRNHHAQDDDDGPPPAPLSSFVGNAVMAGDPCAWHVDADPTTVPPYSPWVHNYGYYHNRWGREEPGGSVGRGRQHRSRRAGGARRSNAMQSWCARYPRGCGRAALCGRVW